MTQSAPSAAGDRPEPELVRGVVEAVNEKGIRVAGQWCNYSRYAEVPRPDVGQWVELVVKNRFITGLKLLGPNGAAPLPEPGEDAPRRAAARRTAAPLDTAPDSDAVPDDVLTVAIQWLVWVEEDDRAPAA